MLCQFGMGNYDPAGCIVESSTADTVGGMDFDFLYGRFRANHTAWWRLSCRRSCTEGNPNDRHDADGGALNSCEETIHFHA
ncbi:MAG: hypothetical protein NVSMB6_01090 [Burkholderiaceae bacterium]